MADQHEDEVLAALDAGERAQLVAVLRRIAGHAGKPPVVRGRA